MGFSFDVETISVCKVSVSTGTRPKSRDLIVRSGRVLFEVERVETVRS